MFCKKCGTQLADDSTFCSKCGEKVAAEETTTVTGADYGVMPGIESEGTTEAPVNNEGTDVVAEPEFVAQPQAPKKNFKKLIIIGAAALTALIAIIVAIVIIVSSVGKANLHKQLKNKEWQRVESSEGVYYYLELDFGENDIEYIFDSTYLTDTIAEYDYKVVGANKIKVLDHSKTYTITFNDEKTMMTITPALTSTDSSENFFWFDGMED